MRKTLKKGFTLTELIIVIVIIAILLAIFIPLLTTYTKKARIVTEKEIVRNLNLALSNDFDYVESGKKHENMHEALKAAAAAGYSVEKINNTKTGNEILWDSVNDVFCYLNGDVIEYIPNSVSQEKALHADDYRLWKISNTIDEYYSTYYTGDLTAINTSKGFDAGEKAGITAVNYTNEGDAQDFVVIRTNGGTLIVNAKNDNVTHYGYADSVNVVDVATASYHENGTVKFLEVAAGHIVLEENSEVSAVHFTATGEGDDAKFENADGKKISIDLSKVEEEKLPSFSRDAVTIKENGTYVAEVKTESTEYIWLFGNGIKEQMVVTESTGAIAENGTLKTGITAGAEDGSVAEQIANPAKRNAEGQLVAADGETVVTAENAVVEEVASKDDIATGQIYFAGGIGSESNPFKVATIEHFYNIYNTDEHETTYYILMSDLTLDDQYYTFDTNMSFDLNKHTLTKIAGNAIFWASDYMAVHNGNIVLTGNNSSVFGDETSTCEIHASNLNISGNVNVTSYHYGALIKYLGNTKNNNELTSKMYVENLTSYVNIKADSASVGGLFGYCLNTSLDLRNISVYSSIETGNTAGGIVMGDSQVCGYSSVAAHQYMTVSNVKFYGNILVPSNKAAYIYGNTVPTGVQDDYKGEGATIVKGINIDNQLIVSENNEFVINADNQYTKYVIKYQFAVDYIDGKAGGYPRNITKEFTINSSEQVNTGIYKYSLVELEKGENDVLVSDSFNGIFTHEGLENTYCYDGQGTFTISSNNRVTVYIYAYSGDNLKAVGTYTYNAVK